MHRRPRAAAVRGRVGPVPVLPAEPLALLPLVALQGEVRKDVRELPDLRLITIRRLFRLN